MKTTTGKVFGFSLAVVGAVGLFHQHVDSLGILVVCLMLSLPLACIWFPEKVANILPLLGRFGA
jgi:hypothetical protein